MVSQSTQRRRKAGKVATASEKVILCSNDAISCAAASHDTPFRCNRRGPAIRAGNRTEGLQYKARRAMCALVDKAINATNKEIEQGRVTGPLCFVARLTNETPRPAETTARPEKPKT